jgi:predicted phage terminase large subunit-like protein
MKFLSLMSKKEQELAADIMRTPDGFAWVASEGKQLRPPHIKYLGQRLADAVAEGSRRICITMPPRHGKSHLTSWWFPTWYLWRFPDRRVILTSYEAEFASSWGRMTRNLLEELHLKGITDFTLADDSKSADRWETSKGGGMMTAGVGGPILGRGGNILICDDPIKNAEEAQSETYRNKTWDWFRTTFLTRLEPNGVVVVIQQRWHEDDLMGRILTSDETKGDWELIDFPALCVDAEGDVLGRKEGQALWPERYDEVALAQIKRQLGSYAFSSLYQQRPVPAEGGIFKTAWFKRRYKWLDNDCIQVGNATYSVADDLRVFSTVDLAASTKTTADYTVIATFGILETGKASTVFLLDVDRRRMEGPDIEQAIRENCARWNPDFVAVEKVGFQLALIQQLQANGLPIREIQPDKDKISRALAITPACESNRVVLPADAEWLTEFEHELYAFPNGKHDDMVDCLAYTQQFVEFGELGVPGDIDLAAAAERGAEIQKALAAPDSNLVGYGESDRSVDFLDLFGK